MKIKKIPYLIVVFGVFILICFSTCKKYPENTLWFKRAKTLSPVGGTITNYCVNGIDSLQYLDAYYNTNFVNNTPNKIHHISDEFFYSSTEDFVIANQTMITGSYRWQIKYKEIEIDCKNDTLVYKKNLFIKRALDWEIIYLGKDNKKSKIKTTYNGNTYEITFER